MGPLTIIINGQGGCGKDSLIKYVQQKFGTEKIWNESSIDPIKKIMQDTVGWNGGKTDADRAFMHSLKKLYTDYCELPNKYLISKYNLADEAGADAIFVHIREPEEIQKFKKMMHPLNQHVIALLIRRNNTQSHHYGNHADDDVENYNYDYIFENNQSLDKTGPEFIKFIENLLTNYKNTQNTNTPT